MDVLLRQGKTILIFLVLTFYTVYAAGPLMWVAIMSLRTTSEISSNPYALPTVLHWAKFVQAWEGSDYGTYFYNSLIVTGGAVTVVTTIGAMAAHCLARFRFPGNRLVLFIILSSLIFPPQIIMISLFQVMVSYGLFNTRIGLILVYVSLQLPLTVYILESFFSRLPQDLFDAAKIDGYSNAEIFYRITLPIGMPAIATTVILNCIQMWNEFLFAVVLLSSNSKRTLPLGIQKFYGDHFNDIGMIATGVMISVIPIIIIYVLFSEKMIKGMTAGAVK